MEKRIDIAAKVLCSIALSSDDTGLSVKSLDEYRNDAAPVLLASDEALFSEEAVKKATEAAYESMRPRMGFPTGIEDAPEGIRRDYETITRAVIDSLKFEQGMPRPL